MIYADARVKVRVIWSQCESWVRPSLLSLRAPRFGGSPQQASGLVPLGREAEKVLSVILKITQRVKVNRRRKRYGSLLQSVVVSVCFHQSLAHNGDLTPYKWIKRRIYFNKEVLWFFPYYKFITISPSVIYHIHIPMSVNLILCICLYYINCIHCEYLRKFSFSVFSVYCN